MAQTNVKLPAIEPGKRPQVLLVGNGLIRALGGDSWDKLIGLPQDKLDKMSENEEKVFRARFDQLPETMKIVVSSEGNLPKKLASLSAVIMTNQPDPGKLELFTELAELPIDQILTTNYSFEIEQAIQPGFKGSSRKNTCYTGEDEKSLRNTLLHRFIRLKYNSRQKDIWHIHGAANKPSSIVIGHQFYGKLTAYIINRVTESIGIIKSTAKKGDRFQPKSWVDYFLAGDIYIIGCGMALSEFDLWWLIATKKANFPDTSIYCFNPVYKREEVLLMLDAYGVMHTEMKGKNYKNYYTEAINKIKELTEMNGGLP